MNVSVITVNLDNAEGLARTLESISTQVFTEFEYLVIDGGSSDGSLKLLTDHAGHIDCWVSESDEGVYHAMNKGVKTAQGDYVLFLNSGDWFANERTLSNFFDGSPREDLVYADINVVSDGSSYRKTYPDSISLRYMKRDSLPHPATLIRRSLFETVGLYDTGLAIVADWKFFLLAICKHGASHRHLDFVASNFDFTGMSSIAANRSRLEAERRAVLQEYFPSPLTRLGRYVQRRLHAH